MDKHKAEIIIIEDNPNDAELIMRVFKKHCLADKFVVLKDGAEATNFLFEQQGLADTPGNVIPKVILLDLKLPKVDGIEVLRRIKSDEQLKNIPVVVLTSSTEPRDLKEAYKLGVNSYVAKPIKFDEFTKTVSELGTYWLLLNRLPAQ